MSNSKNRVNLKFSELCMIKHALKRQCEFKETIEKDDSSIVSKFSITPEKLKKDLKEEKELLNKITDIIDCIRNRYN